MMEHFSKLAFLFFSGIIVVIFVTELISFEEDENKEIEKCKERQHCHVMEKEFTSKIEMPNNKGLFTTFCHTGFRLKTFGILSSAGIVIAKNTGLFKVSNMDVYHGKSISEMEQQAKNSYRIPTFIKVKAETEYHSMEYAGVSCVLVDSDGDFSVKYVFNYLDYRNLVMLAAGMILFIISKPISETKLMHYGIAALLFMVGWFHIIVYLCIEKLTRSGKHVQHKRNRNHVLGFCLASFLYVLYILWVFLTGYWRIVVLQCFISGVLGLAYVYRYHTVSDKRTIDILTWGLQIIGVLLVWNAITITTAGTTLCVLLVTFYYWDNLIYSGHSGTVGGNAKKTNGSDLTSRKMLPLTTDQKTNLCSKGIPEKDSVNGEHRQLTRVLQRQLLNDDYIRIFVLDYCNMVLQYHENVRSGEKCSIEVLAMVEHLKRLLHLATFCRWQVVVSIHEDFMFEIKNGTKVWGDGTADIEMRYFN